jgi:hypothetical protein
MIKAELRPFVFEALRREPETQFSTIEHYVRDLAPDFNRHDVERTLREIIWELLIQGVLAPDVHNTRCLLFPFVRVTEYGSRCLEAGNILPHDPDGYLERLQQKVGEPLDDIVLTYVRESLLTFLGGHYLAATVMLGVASERCIDMLIDAYSSAIADPGRRADFERELNRAGRSIAGRFRALREELLQLRTLPSGLRDALDIQLSGIFTLIRYSRNEAGHPTGATVDRDAANANLLLFPQYCQRVYGLINHFRANSA